MEKRNLRSGYRDSTLSFFTKSLLKTVSSQTLPLYPMPQRTSHTLSQLTHLYYLSHVLICFRTPSSPVHNIIRLELSSSSYNHYPFNFFINFKHQLLLCVTISYHGVHALFGVLALFNVSFAFLHKLGNTIDKL